MAGLCTTEIVCAGLERLSHPIAVQQVRGGALDMELKPMVELHTF